MCVKVCLFACRCPWEDSQALPEPEFSDGGANPLVGGTILLLFPKFPENCMKLKKKNLGQRGCKRVQSNLGLLLGCNFCCQELSRCCTGGESEGSIATRSESRQARDLSRLQNTWQLLPTVQSRGTRGPT